MIIICPRGGLANRMRVMAWAMSLAEEAETNVSCRWISNHELGASFENLFQPIDNLKVTGEATYHPRSANSCKGFKKFRNKLWNKLDYLIFVRFKFYPVDQKFKKEIICTPL